MNVLKSRRLEFSASFSTSSSTFDGAIPETPVASGVVLYHLKNIQIIIIMAEGKTRNGDLCTGSCFHPLSGPFRA
jgi:hypothetical protein